MHKAFNQPILSALLGPPVHEASNQTKPLAQSELPAYKTPNQLILLA